MFFSIIIPTFNNINYLKFLLHSLKKNSFYNHEIILHVNDGSDGTLDYVLENKLKFTHSKNNIGLCSSMNLAFTKSTSDYILYSHDDMFFCKNWDIYLLDELKKHSNDLFYLTGLNISKQNGLINYDCGDNIYNFDEEKFNFFCSNDLTVDLQGSHWAPHLIHRNMWNKINGFSEEFNPGDGSDPDLCMKLWLENVRIFKCISKFKVYHFNSITTRKREINLNDGTKKFLLKYGFNPRFFRKYYLRSDKNTAYLSNLSKPKINFDYLFQLLINKAKFYYTRIIS